MNNDPMSYLHRSGIMSSGVKKEGRSAPKVTTVGMAVKRPPEMNVSAGPGKGLSEGNRPIKGTGANRYGSPPKGVMNGDGWEGKKNTPSRVGPETGPSKGFETAGDAKARAAGKKGVETQSPKVEKKKGLAKTANIEGNESKMYERLEKKSLRSMKQGGSEKELRAGHNDAGKVEKTMREFKKGALHSGSKKGPKVTSRKQAIAIGLSQARKAGEKVAPMGKKA